VTLLHLGRAEEVWPLFRRHPDPTERSYLVQRAGPLGVEASLLVGRLLKEKDPSARAALIVALGEYTEAQLPAGERLPLTDKLLGWYRDDPSPAVHGAIDWLLRHGREGPAPRPLDWGRREELERLDRALARPGPDGRRGWYVNRQGQTMVLVPDPGSFHPGSPHTDPDRNGLKEGRELWKVGRNYTRPGREDPPHPRPLSPEAGPGGAWTRPPALYALASKPVTVAQFERFLKEPKRPRAADRSHVRRYSPDAEGPVVAVTWYEAAAYCNWLSDRERIPRAQWCYPEKIEPGGKLFDDFLSRAGYRLPTEVELEHACRAGTSSNRYFGSSLELLPRYAHYLPNARQRAWPVGQKRPNDWGLFDTHGNAWNWCENFGLGVDVNSRYLRGGGFPDEGPAVRSPHRRSDAPGAVNPTYGFRVCRTCQ
jgi:formylglycine-generating enzyme required for sulfatase activity